MKTGLIFDMDGTLWDSSENVAAAWCEKIQQEYPGRKGVSRDDIMGVMGLTMDRIADILFGDLPESERYELLDKCGNSENDYLRVHGGKLYPDIEKTLTELGKKYPLYIVSNCQSGYIEAFLEYYSFGKYFEDIECYGNNKKEKSENISLIMERNGLDKAYYIGDIQGDCDSSEKAGAQFIHASYGFGTIDHPVPELKSFSGLPELLADIDK